MAIQALQWTSLSPEPLLLSARQHQTDDIAVLTTIFEPDVNLSIWQRHLAPSIQHYADDLLIALKHPIQRRVALHDVSLLLDTLLPAANGKKAFIADVQQVADIFACLMDCAELGVRLSALQQPMCPKFHTDHLVCRLVSTYAGPGTEWHSGPLSDPATCHALNTGDVALLKGSGWEDIQTYAISHRSPVVAGTRVLLTLDPIW